MKSFFLSIILAAFHLVNSLPADTSPAFDTSDQRKISAESVRNEGKQCKTIPDGYVGVCTAAEDAKYRHLLVSQKDGGVDTAPYVRCSHDDSSQCEIFAPRCDQGGVRTSFCLNDAQKCNEPPYQSSVGASKLCPVDTYCCQIYNIEVPLGAAPSPDFYASSDIRPLLPPGSGESELGNQELLQTGNDGVALGGDRMTDNFANLDEYH